MENQRKREAVERIQAYIMQHLEEPICLSDLSKVSGYSPWNTARMFKQFTGKTAFEFIRKVRLSHAAIRLQGEKTRVIDVAFDFVFGTHEGFTRAFSREFGVSPREFQKNPRPVEAFLPMNFRQTYLTSREGERTMAEKSKPGTVFIQVVDRPERKLILKRGKKATHYFEFCDEVGCEVWDVLTGIPEALYEPIGMWMPENLREPGTSVYTQGVEVPVDFHGTVPEGFEIIELKPCKMMVFQGPPYDDEKFGDAIGDLWEVMKQFDPKLYGYEWADEEGPRFQLAPMGYRGYIEARPVRPIKP